MATTNQSELDWLAFRYVAGELAADELAADELAPGELAPGELAVGELAAFEQQLAVDQAAREAVARAVALAQTSAMALHHDRRLSRTENKSASWWTWRDGGWGRLAWTGCGLAAGLALAVLIADGPSADQNRRGPPGLPSQVPVLSQAPVPSPAQLEGGTGAPGHAGPGSRTGLTERAGLTERGHLAVVWASTRPSTLHDAALELGEDEWPSGAGGEHAGMVVLTDTAGTLSSTDDAAGRANEFDWEQNTGIEPPSWMLAAVADQAAGSSLHGDGVDRPLVE